MGLDESDLVSDPLSCTVFETRFLDIQNATDLRETEQALEADWSLATNDIAAGTASTASSGVHRVFVVVFLETEF